MHPSLHKSLDVDQIILRSEALADGVTDRTLQRLLRSGELHRVRHGAYTSGQLWTDADASTRHRILARAVVLGADHPPVLSHTTAAIEHGADIWDLPLDRVHVTLPSRHRGRTTRDISPHSGVLLDDDVIEKDGLRIVAPARAGLEVATLTDVEHAVVVIDSLLRAAVTSVEEVREQAERMARWPGSLGREITLGLVDPQSGSVGESRTRYLMWREHLPKPETQFPVLDDYGHELAFLDFAWPELGVFIEFDGRYKYDVLLRPGESAADAIMREKAREREVVDRTGWICIRLTWADLANPRRTAELIRRALVRGHARAVLA